MNSLCFEIPGTGWISVLSLWRKWEHIKYGLLAVALCIRCSCCCGAKGCLQYRNTPVGPNCIWNYLGLWLFPSIYRSLCKSNVLVFQEGNRAVQSKTRSVMSVREWMQFSQRNVIAGLSNTDILILWMRMRVWKLRDVYKHQDSALNLGSLFPKNHSLSFSLQQLESFYIG